MASALRSWVNGGVAGALIALAFVVPENLAENQTFGTAGYYTSKTPYPEPYREALEAPPVGYAAVMVQHLARHGSRLLSSPGDDDLALRLWAQARHAEALTDLGEAMEAVLRDIAEVHRRMGYGSISTRGVREHEAMAARLHARQRELLEAGLASGRQIAVLHSGRTRAEQSARAFVDGLIAAQATLAPLIAEPEADPETVYFHGGSEADDATAFLQYRESDSRLQAVLARLENDRRTATMARAMLEPLFQRSFVDDLESGRYRIQTPVDDDEITDSVSAAKVLYALYSIASNLDLDADVDLGPFLHPDAVAFFAYVDDAETFY